MEEVGQVSDAMFTDLVTAIFFGILFAALVLHALAGLNEFLRWSLAKVYRYLTRKRATS